jgi:RNA polymerase sigma-70 factor, ECF subfamily
MSSPEDGALIEKVLQGEKSCFEEIVKKYQASLYNMAFRMTLDREAARDITQDTFLQAYRSLQTFRGEGKFSSWLYRILSHRCLNHIRRRKKIPFSSLDAMEQVIRSGSGDPPAECEKREAGERLLREVEKLSGDQKMVFTLFHVTGSSYGEISSILGIPESKVKSDLFRARKQLRICLEDLWK